MGTRATVKTPPVDAAGPVDAERPRPPLLENHRTVFYSAHKALFLHLHDGDISIELKPGTFLFRFDKSSRQELTVEVLGRMVHR